MFSVTLLCQTETCLERMLEKQLVRVWTEENWQTIGSIDRLL